jgi:hypothetical protein
VAAAQLAAAAAPFSNPAAAGYLNPAFKQLMDLNQIQQQFYNPFMAFQSPMPAQTQQPSNNSMGTKLVFIEIYFISKLHY